MENKKDCPMCKISDEVIKKLEQSEYNKNNQNDSEKVGFAIVRKTGLLGKFTRLKFFCKKILAGKK
ncbi:MAG: hypothetical protein US76_02125 [Parcubacteria group bacterium GW2011_GWA2_38_13b]|nr:MAG: hypothetical protein US76_02125 [Parcubacteria group bacterium GW2011_GWA2_38_13b]